MNNIFLGVTLQSYTNNVGLIGIIFKIVANIEFNQIISKTFFLMITRNILSTKPNY